MINNQVLNFFIEIWYRLKTKSPKIFFILQVLGGGLTLLGYVPSMMQQWFNVQVPGHIITMCEDISKYAAGFFAAALLPATTPPVAQTESGEAIKVTDDKKFPFTAKVESKAMDKEVPPVPVENVPENKP